MINIKLDPEQVEKVVQQELKEMLECLQEDRKTMMHLHKDSAKDDKKIIKAMKIVAEYYGVEL